MIRETKDIVIELHLPAYGQEEFPEPLTYEQRKAWEAMVYPRLVVVALDAAADLVLRLNASGVLLRPDAAIVIDGERHSLTGVGT